MFIIKKLKKKNRRSKNYTFKSLIKINTKSIKTFYLHVSESHNHK